MWGAEEGCVSLWLLVSPHSSNRFETFILPWQAYKEYGEQSRTRAIQLCHVYKNPLCSRNMKNKNRNSCFNDLKKLPTAR